jgi:N-formylglutamate amidohydrolase
MDLKTFKVFRPLPERRLPIIVHMPHVSRWIPGEVEDTFCASHAELHVMHEAMRDLHVTNVFWDALHYGASLFVNDVSRLVYDPERYEDDEIELMSRVGLGMVYTRTLEGRPLRHPDPSGEMRRAVIENFHKPYVAAMEALIEEHLAEFGEVWIIDAHSYPDEQLPFLPEGSPRPAVCLGTARTSDPGVDPALAWFSHNEEWLLAYQHDGAPRALGFNEPFAGSYVPLRYVDDPRVHSLMIELNRTSIERARIHPMLVGMDADDTWNPRIHGAAGGKNLGHAIDKFLGWFAAYVARTTGVTRAPINKILVQGMALRRILEWPMDSRTLLGDLIDGRRCRVDPDLAHDINLDIDHLEDCWVCHVDAPDLARLGSGCTAPMHMFINKWTGEIRWMGQVPVEILDEPDVSLPYWERHPDGYGRNSVCTGRCVSRDLSEILYKKDDRNWEVM